MNENNATEHGVIRASVGLMGVAVALCAAKTCRCIFDKPDELKRGFKLQS